MSTADARPALEGAGPAVEARPAGLARPETAIAIGVLVLAAVALFASFEIPESAYAKVSPRLAPYAVIAGLFALGAALLRDALRGGWQEAEEREAVLDRRALLWIGLGLVLNIVLIDRSAVGVPPVAVQKPDWFPTGFTLASTAMFVCIARGFGSRRPLRDAGLGLLLALAAYFGFAKTLGINIGAGTIEAALEPAWTAVTRALGALFGGGA